MELLNEEVLKKRIWDDVNINIIVIINFLLLGLRGSGTNLWALQLISKLVKQNGITLNL